MLKQASTPADFLEVFTTNVGGVHNSTVAFLPLLKQGPTKKICNITSTLGCVSQVADNPFPVPAYKVSKAALNMLTAEWALQTTAKEGLIFIPLSPGVCLLFFSGLTLLAGADVSMNSGLRLALDQSLLRSRSRSVRKQRSG